MYIQRSDYTAGDVELLYLGGEHDTERRIPLVSFPQRGGLNLEFSVYLSSKQWESWVNPVNCANQSDPTGCTPLWVPMHRGAQVGVGNLPVEGAYVASSVDWLMENECNVTPGNDANGNVASYDWSANVTAPDGTTHSLGQGFSSSNCGVTPYRSVDVSGILQSDAGTVVMPSGTHYNYGSNGNLSTVVDSNGNKISIDPNSGFITDTM